jgi:hypothetical protein
MRRILVVLLLTLAVCAPTVAHARPGSATAAARPGVAADHTWLAPTLHRWSTCHPIRYRLNPSGMRKHWRQEVRRALRRVTTASGLRFRYVGKTSFVPDGRRPDPRGTDLVVAVTDRAIEGDPTAVGEGGAVPLTVRHHRVLRSGFVLLRRSLFAGLAAGFGRGHRIGEIGSQGQALMHELGHAVGLGHARRPAEIMYPVLTRKPARWGAGDLAGLRVLGSGPCVRGA